MDFLKAALKNKMQDLSQKRKIVETTVGKRKYVRRRDLQDAEDRAREEEQRALKRQRLQEDGTTVVPMQEEETKDTPAADAGEVKTKERFIPPQEVKRRLRALRQPITLFGETDKARRERLKLVELVSHEKHHGSMGAANQLQELEKEVAAEILQAGAGDLDNTAELKKKAEKAKKKMLKYQEDKGPEAFEGKEAYVMYFFKRMLRLWEQDLNDRPQEEKITTQGMHATATQKQTRKNLKPLFDLLKLKTVSQDILKHLNAVVDACRIKNYTKANEKYLLMAIGNAAWPMGVTMVGIHERAGREKIFSQNTAHVLNDETQRKYIQGVKRLMTYCQDKFPSIIVLH